jgi:probable F420-dependent oxidoreductase
MKVGYFFWPAYTEYGKNGELVRWRDVQAMARTAERVGWDSFWLADHVLFRPSSGIELGQWEAFTFLAALAASTSRIQFGPLVAAAPMRNPALLAKMADTLDEISDGRFILGLGAGWNKPEFQAFGYPFDHPASRFEEDLRIIVPLLREGRADFHGKYERVENAVLRPRGPSKSGPPLWIGATGPRMMELAARYGDAFNTAWHTTAQEVVAKRDELYAICERIGRDPATIELTAGAVVRVGKPGESMGFSLAPKGIEGEPEQIADALRDFAAAGVRHMVIIPEPFGEASIERFGEVLRLLDQ